MNTLTAVRQEVADQLNDQGIEARDFIPARLQPPVVVIAAGSPYLETDAGQTFTDIRVRFSLTLVAATATNEKATEQLDEMICDTYKALSNWDLEQVGEPFGLEANGAVYLAVTAVISASIEMKEEN